MELSEVQNPEVASIPISIKWDLRKTLYNGKLSF